MKDENFLPQVSLTPQEWDRRTNMAAAAILASLDGQFPKVGVTLGSGFKAFLPRVKIRQEWVLAEIPFFQSPTVKGHGASLVVGEAEGRSVAIMTGRVHLYEGYSAQDIVFGTRVLHRLGVDAVILTNAAGGVNSAYPSGSTILIADHMNLTGQHCLTGDGGFFGPQFLDMTNCYGTVWRNKMKAKFGLSEGVYVGLTGPTYETPAECRMLRLLGGDMVGMSTVHEAIAAHHLGMRVGGLSFITNASAGAGEDGGQLTHDEVIAQGKKHERVLADILSYGIACMHKE